MNGPPRVYTKRGFVSLAPSSPHLPSIPRTIPLFPPLSPPHSPPFRSYSRPILLLACDIFRELRPARTLRKSILRWLPAPSLSYLLFSPHPYRALFSSSLSFFFLRFFASRLFLKGKRKRGRRGTDRCFLSRQRRVERRRGQSTQVPFPPKPGGPVNCRFTTQRRVTCNVDVTCHRVSRTYTRL